MHHFISGMQLLVSFIQPTLSLLLAVGSNALHPFRWQDTQIIIDKR
jgi:hypothetical protein